MKTKENFILYGPAEDSFLIQKHIKNFAHGTVLEIGTGSGILATTAAQCSAVKSVLAVDIQKEVIEHCKKTLTNDKITFQQSDLFSTVKGTFDCIIFNPPYLPTNPRAPDITLDAGKKGYELIVRFLNDVNTHLKPDGTLLLLFSSFSRKKIIDDQIKQNLLEAKQIDQQHISFETLYVYAIKKSSLLKEMEENNITSVRYFARGKRGLAYKGVYNGKHVIVKIQHPSSETPSTVQFEAEWLRKLNPKKIGPTLFFATKHFLVMEFIDGLLFEKFLHIKTKKDILSLIKKLLQQMFLLDTLGTNKYEMNHPDKHIIIRAGIPTLIDFERCRHTEDPKNVTQFLQFLSSLRITLLLQKKGIFVDKEKLHLAARVYKLDRKKQNFDKIIKLVK